MDLSVKIGKVRIKKLFPETIIQKIVETNSIFHGD